MLIKLSDYVARFIRDQRVGHVFLLPGGGNMHLVDSVGRCEGIEYVCNLHEQACSFAAVAYGDLRNDLGVAMVTTGPGGTNAVTGVAAAWVESVSCLFISGQAKRADLLRARGVRSMGQQEIDIVSIVQPITKYAVTVLDPQEICYHLEKAVHLARTGRRGPVWIDIPLDVQATMIDESRLSHFATAEQDSSLVPTVLRDLAAQALGLLVGAERPIILAGYGIRSAGAEVVFRQVIDMLQIPVLTTWKAIDLLPEDHPLFVGRPGAVGQRGANFSQQNSDCILAIGARLDLPQVAFNHINFARAAKKIMADVDAAEIRKMQTPIDLPVVADAKRFLEELHHQSSKVASPGCPTWLQQCKEWQSKYPTVLPEYWHEPDVVDQYVLMDVLSDETVAADILAPGSSGPSSDIFMQAFRVKAGQRIRNFPGLGAMGSGLPGSIGACLAASTSRTICINGDGGFQLNIQDLETVRRLGLPIKFFVVNNGGYASIMAMQRNYFEGRYVGSEATSGLTFPELRDLATAYRIPWLRVCNHAELRSKVREVLDTPGPVICEVIASANQVVAPRATSKVQPDGTIVSRPMEDMWPLLPREELDANMSIGTTPVGGKVSQE